MTIWNKTEWIFLDDPVLMIIPSFPIHFPLSMGGGGSSMNKGKNIPVKEAVTTRQGKYSILRSTNISSFLFLPLSFPFWLSSCIIPSSIAIYHVSLIMFAFYSLFFPWNSSWISLIFQTMWVSLYSLSTQGFVDCNCLLTLEKSPTSGKWDSMHNEFYT